MSQKLSIIALLVLAPLACDSSDTLPDVTPDALGAPAGKADGSEVSISPSGGYDVLQIRGDAASDLYAQFDRAGGFSEQRRGGLEYRYGTYSICVSNGEAAACNLYSRAATLDEGGFLATIHGERFDSASSEVFSALARAQGDSPAALDEVRSGSFLCAKTSAEVWCGVSDSGADDVSLALSFAGLPALGDDFVYEGWLITEEGPVTSGRFVVTEGSDEHVFSIDRALADAGTTFVLTIEPKFGDDPAPSSTHIVAGPFVEGVAQLSTNHGAALGTDFLGAKGGFILETPTTAGVAEDFDQGVWFLEPAAGPGAGLELPELPAGWRYEGWVVGEAGPVSTGTFTDPSAADRDGAGPTAGPDGAPPFPGQDFINPAMKLVGTTVVLSVEPDPDDSPAPFFIKPLAGGVADEGAGVFQELGNIAAESQVSGLATLE
ncbi:MAG: anti-sigma factor [Nannocystaceae bacterium]|nr:anti-sigma factor [Nannocystaceae bacterium]